MKRIKALFKKKKLSLPKVLPAPALPKALPTHSKWLSGEGAGSWFVLREKKDKYLMIRYSPNGVEECRSFLEKNPAFDLSVEFNLTYPSNCSIITILQKGNQIQLKKAL